jgi:signal peptidase I
MDWKRFWKKTWYFIWESDSILSWIANIIIAFVLIKFVIYPALGFALQTNYPVVAVVSGSMEHKTPNPCIDFNRNTNDCIIYNKGVYSICGKDFDTSQNVDFDFFWNTCGDWYTNNTDIAKDEFSSFQFKDGFNTGDIMILRGSKAEKIKTGDVIVYISKTASYPIIHRVVEIKNESNYYTFITKGDHNNAADPVVDERQILGKAVVRAPYLGWIKIGFVKLVNFFRGA